MEEIWKMLLLAVGMALYYRMYELVDHVFSLALDNKLSVGYMDGVSDVQATFDLRASNNSALSQATF